MKTVWLALGLVSFACDAGTIYLCKKADGETFWTAGQCSQHNAIRKGIARVPDGLSFEQQVRVVEESGNQTECKGLGAQIANLDARARQPQSGESQAGIAAKRKQARDRQSALNCR